MDGLSTLLPHPDHQPHPRSGRVALTRRSRPFQALTRGSSRAHNVETVDLENSTPGGSLVTASTLRVETPLHDHLHQRQDKSLLAPLVTLPRSGENSPPRRRGTCSSVPTPRLQRALPMPVAVALPHGRPLVRQGLEQARSPALPGSG